METNDNNNMDNMDNIVLSFCKNCRICLQIHQQMVSIQLLEELEDFNTILAYFNVEVMTDLRYPNGICMVCLNQLRSFILFKQKCETSSSYLRNILNDSEFQIPHIFGNELIKVEDPVEYGFDQVTNIDARYQKITDEICVETVNNSDIKTEEPDTSETTLFLCNKCNSSSETCNCTNNHIKSEIDVDGNKDSDKDNLFSKDKSKNSFRCKYCAKTFIKSFRLQTHERTHERRFKCDYCLKSFLNENTLTRHIRIHLGLKPYFCTECSQSFISHSGFTQHKRKTHSDNPPPKVTCQKCGKAVFNLSAHIRYKHNTRNSFQCQYCGKNYAYKFGLQCHVKDFHENFDEAFKVLCTLCGKKFRRMSDLNKHNQSAHSNERNYPCRYCDTRFKTSNDRYQHERKHLNDRRYKCTYCPKAFLNGKTLANHIFIHTGEKPFSCSICSKAFRQKETLRNHTRLVHGRIPQKLQSVV